MRLLLLVAVLAAALFAVPTFSLGDSDKKDKAKPKVVKRIVNNPPKKVVVRKKIDPVVEAQPTGNALHRMISEEAARYGVSASHLSSRVNCESTYRWWASNGGTYHGLLQFHPNTFYRGMSGLDSHRVVRINSKTRRSKRKRVIRRKYSNGSTRYKIGKRIRQKLIVRRVATIPNSPPITHGRAQLRIGAQAIAGVGTVNNSEWECR